MCLIASKYDLLRALNFPDSVKPLCVRMKPLRFGWEASVSPPLPEASGRRGAEGFRVEQKLFSVKEGPVAEKGGEKRAASSANCFPEALK